MLPLFHRISCCSSTRGSFRTSLRRRCYQYRVSGLRAKSTQSEDSPTYQLYRNVEYVDRYCPGGYHPIEVNDTLNQRYHIVDKLGQGGYSTIWLARDQKLNNYVAVKVGTARLTKFRKRERFSSNWLAIRPMTSLVTSSLKYLIILPFMGPTAHTLALSLHPPDVALPNPSKLQDTNHSDLT